MSTAVLLRSIILITAVGNLNVHAQLNGTYHIGGATPDYATLDQAFQACVSPGLSGPVIFELHDALFQESLDIDMSTFTSVTETNTVTFTDAVGCTVQWSSTGTTPLWRILNAHNIRFEGITWKNTSLFYSSALFDISGNATDVEFQGNNFQGGNPHIKGTMDALDGITVTNNCFGNSISGVRLEPSGSNKNLRDIVITRNFFAGGMDEMTLGHAVNARVDSNMTSDADCYGFIHLYNCDSSFVRDNTAIGLYSGYSIHVEGGGFAQPFTCDGVTVSGNHLDFDSAFGIQFEYCQNSVVSGNELVGGFCYDGILGEHVDGITISNNSLQDINERGIAVEYASHDVVITGNTVNSIDPDAVGIYVHEAYDPGSTYRVSENRIVVPATATGIELDITGTSAQPVLVANNEVRGGPTCLNLSGSYMDVAFNSFLASDPTNSPLVLDVDGLRFADNVVSAWGASYASEILVTNADPANDFHHNIYHYDASAPGAALTTQHATLAAAQAAGLETGSLLLDPEFVDPATSLFPGNAALDGAGAPFTDVVFDIDGLLRDATNPTPGAYETIATAIAGSIIAPLTTYPIPFNDRLWVDLDRALDARFEMLDARGRIVVRGPLPEHGPIISGLGLLRPGHYVLRVISTDGVRQAAVMRMP